VTEPQWLDVAAPAVQLRALTWGRADAPIALCLHGFPDTAYSWRKVASGGAVPDSPFSKAVIMSVPQPARLAAKLPAS
jgi:pimeloyl-ACP methyl ester carboxylesterase